eukprot:CAMPEP_0201502666 /NCGR_PEP_ID=MMETSP0151_2-20130828/84258_1 /ASSEMBLY_ACC=CAM_ASM_000257 /TAXON_ID=200890 /ORGANISM="Paramoeba atlantica, Strain 621/1 / CCAP 1560/9" /LENGTH=190 /DNA_ID=CAMNT_0047896277 /DNA_START=1661 /DNA_END=2234 /DNA_ORIENTATION=-
MKKNERDILSKQKQLEFVLEQQLKDHLLKEVLFLNLESVYNLDDVYTIDDQHPIGRPQDGERDHKEDEDVWVLNSLQISVTQTRDVPLMKERERDILSKQKQLEFVLEQQLKDHLLKEVHLRDSGEEEHQVDCEGKQSISRFGQHHSQGRERRGLNDKENGSVLGGDLTIFGGRLMGRNLKGKVGDQRKA